MEKASPSAAGMPGAAGTIGFLSYGISLALFVVALRYLGAARTGAYFSTAPFAGALIAIPLLSEPVTVQVTLAGVLMGAGVWLHLTERHHHRHTHASIEHEHVHEHDAHHQHPHTEGQSADIRINTRTFTSLRCMHIRIFPMRTTVTGTDGHWQVSRWVTQ